jgi:hypothetical protein
MIIPCKAIFWYISNLTFSQGLRYLGIHEWKLMEVY